MEEIAIQLTLDGQGRTPASPDFDPADVKQYGLSHVFDCTGPITTLFGNPQPSVAADGEITWTEPSKDAIRWYYSAIWEKHFIPPRGGAVDQWAVFGSGQAAMAYAPLWNLSLITSQQTWDIAPVPSHNGQIVSYTDVDGLMALSTTEYPQEAARAILYLASMLDAFKPEDREIMSLPARTDFQPPYLAALDARYPQGVNWQVALDSLPYSQYSDHDYRTDPLCQDEFMDRLSRTPGLNLEAEFDQ